MRKAARAASYVRKRWALFCNKRRRCRKTLPNDLVPQIIQEIRDGVPGLREEIPYKDGIGLTCRRVDNVLDCDAEVGQGQDEDEGPEYEADHSPDYTPSKMKCYYLGMPRNQAISNTKEAALKHFKKADPQFHAATKRHHSSLPGTLPSMKTKRQLFERLVRTVISQQLGTAAARSIFARVKEACGGSISVESVRTVTPAKLRKAGLSGAKIKTIKEIAKAVHTKSLNLLSLKTAPEEQAAEALLAIWGLGPWSVEMFLMFALGRSDVFSPGDLGLVRAIEAIYKLPKNAPRSSLLAIAEKWAPYRTYASLLLWKTRDTNPLKPL